MNIDDIIKHVSKAYKVRIADVLGASRLPVFVVPRQVIMYLGATILGASKSEIGRCLKRDHATVLSGIRAVEARMGKNEVFRDTVDLLAMDFDIVADKSGCEYV